MLVASTVVCKNCKCLCDMQSLLDLVANEVSSESCKQDEQLQKFYSNSLEHIRAQKATGNDLSDQYEALNI